jgi:hypothetical protein
LEGIGIKHAVPASFCNQELRHDLENRQSALSGMSNRLPSKETGGNIRFGNASAFSALR